MRFIKVHIEYDINVMTSYEMSNYVDKLFGEDKVVSFFEVRDSGGNLTGFDIEAAVNEEFLK
jgi:hypothetical protein